MYSLKIFGLLFLFAQSLIAAENVNDIEIWVYEAESTFPVFSQVRSSSFDARFKKVRSGLRYHLSNSTIWIKFRKKETEPRTLFFELTSPNLHYIDYFSPDPASPGEFFLQETGFLKNFASRPIDVGPNVLPFQTTGEWYFVRVRSGHFLNADVEVLTNDELLAKASYRTLFYSAYAGIMFIIVAGAVLFTYLGKQYHYLFYAGYVLLISTINLTEKGFYFQFLWPDLPQLNFYFPLLPYGVSFCLMLFLQKTFRIASSSKVMYWINLWIVTGALFVLTTFYLVIGSYRIAFLFAEIHGLVSCLLIFVMNVRAYRILEEYKPFLKLMIIGLGFFCFGVIIYLLSQNDLVPVNFFTENMIVLGTAAEVCFFTASLAFYQQSLSRKYYDLIAVQNEILQEGIAARTKELQQRNEELCNSLEEKENLMHIVAHDLRSPLNQTKALGSLIAMAVRNVSEVHELVDRMQTANERGIRLIDELSAVARLEADSQNLTFETINVHGRLSPVLQNFASLAKGKNINLEVESAEDCVVVTHAPYLIRIIENLLSNAMKFSANGSTVRLAIRKGKTCEIVIDDHGPGFSEDDMRKVFRKFQKLSAVPTGGEHSTGLGLYIVKLLVDRIEAELSLKSEVGKGSSFRLTFKEQNTVFGRQNDLMLNPIYQ